MAKETTEKRKDSGGGCGRTCEALWFDDHLKPHLRPPPLWGVLSSLISTFVLLCVSTVFYFSFGQMFGCMVFVVFIIIIAIEEESAWERKYPSTNFYIPFGVVTVLAAIFVGIKVHTQVYAPYYLAVSGRDYYDVSALASSQEFADGGIMHFDNDTALDTSRSFGFQGFDHVYCAAPVVSRSRAVHPQSTGPEVAFWAVGLDCCGNRQDFECDGAGDLEVRSAFTVKELRRDLLTRLMVPLSSRPMYLKAIQAAKALHGLKSDLDQILLLRWAAEPAETLAVWYNRAWITVVFAICVYSIIISIAWSCIHLSFLSNEEDGMKNKGDRKRSSLLNQTRKAEV